MNYRSRMNNILHGSWKSYDYMAGHRDARHAAAEIANEADALCKELAGALEESDAWVKGSHNMLAPLLGIETPAMSTLRKIDSALTKYREIVK